MRWAGWEPFYEEILEEFGYPREFDEAARDRLRQLLPPARTVGEDVLRGLVAERKVTVVGAGPGVLHLRERDVTGSEVVVACDGATGPVLDAGVVPDLVVTDLDGDVARQVEASKAGSVVVVHAHGDNVPALEAWVPRFPGRLAGTTQAEPTPPVLNLGGFTDGDRAVHLCDELGAREVRLVAWDLDTVGPLGTGDREVKRRKLAWARRLLAEVDVPVRSA